MVKDTIQAIKDTEQKAEELIEKAKKEAAQMTEDAQKEAAQIEKEMIAQASRQAEEALQEAEKAGLDLWKSLKTHGTSGPLWKLDCGVDAEKGVSALDLRIILIMK